MALAVGLPLELKGVPFVKAWKEKMKRVGTVPPIELKDAPITENVISGTDRTCLNFQFRNGMSWIGQVLWHRRDNDIT